MRGAAQELAPAAAIIVPAINEREIAECEVDRDEGAQAKQRARLIEREPRQPIGPLAPPKVATSVVFVASLAQDRSVPSMSSCSPHAKYPMKSSPIDKRTKARIRSDTGAVLRNSHSPAI